MLNGLPNALVSLREQLCIHYCSQQWDRDYFTETAFSLREIEIYAFSSTKRTHEYLPVGRNEKIKLQYEYTKSIMASKNLTIFLTKAYKYANITEFTLGFTEDLDFL
jgi:hypothetical protein